MSFPWLLGVCLVTPVHAQTAAADPVAVYRQLLNPAITAANVFQIRQVAFDREDLHVVLIDGTIGLLQAVDGHVTGAFFEGEGEITLWPPDRAEKTSLELFTGAGVLDQKFHSAYLRFLDDKLVEELRSGMRPAEDTQDFIQRWKEPVQSLARSDSFQLLQALTDSGEASSRILHVRLGGTSLGVFDVFFNTSATEQISLAQATVVKGAPYYDIWASFPMRSVRQAGKNPVARGGPLRASDIRIRTTINPPAELQSEAELTLSVRRSGQRTLILELSRNLKVTEVKAGGQSVPFIQNEAVDGSELARRGNDLVAVVLPAPMEKDVPFHLSLKYSGAVMFDTGGDLLYVGARGTWYPNPGPFFTNFDLTFEYPPEWTLVATGRRVSSALAEGVQTTHFLTDKPIVHAGFNLGKFTAATATVDGIVIDTYAAGNVEADLARLEQRAGLHPEPARHVQKISEQAVSAVKFLSGELGAFPYSHLEITQLPALLSQAWPGLIYLSSTAYLTVEERRALKIGDPFSELLLDELMLAHETAHQWWGDAVDWESYRDEWIVEALANYSALLMLERASPQKMTIALDHYRKQLLQTTPNGAMNEAGPVTLGNRLTSSKFPGAYEPVLYGRGTWLVHMLRTMLRQANGGNDALFFKALSGLLARSPNGKISTRDLQRAFEQVMPPALAFEGHKSLDWFFDGWVNGDSVPEFSLEDLKMTPAGPRVKVRGAVRQRFADKDLVTAVPLYGQDKDGRLKFLSLVFVDEPLTSFEIDAPVGVKTIVLDPDHTLLRR
ncbi:MAG TPA: M1 family aminopeptidase [Candidatus Saccharimonadales bacterium]|nr:M1 family aminopeptidase [Candidatus Saccharimonadales bacterium]